MLISDRNHTAEARLSLKAIILLYLFMGFQRKLMTVEESGIFLDDTLPELSGESECSAVPAATLDRSSDQHDKEGLIELCTTTGS